jgi:hypothetical protein
VDRLTALEAEVDALVERIAVAMHTQSDDAILECEQQVDLLLAQLDQCWSGPIAR